MTDLRKLCIDAIANPSGAEFGQEHNLKRFYEAATPQKCLELLNRINVLESALKYYATNEPIELCTIKEIDDFQSIAHEALKEVKG